MRNSKAILIIMDGVGINNNTKNNAVALAKTPCLDKLLKEYPHTQLQASGHYVGLPDGQMGNSEVGHLNIGAGRIVYTGLSLINKELEDGQFYKNEAFLKAINHVKKHHSKFHIMGLCSNGGVHSNLNHILALIDLAYQNNVQPVLHCFSDGRDVDPKTFINDLPIILSKLQSCNGLLATISGRYYAMDRDKRWDRVELAYKAITCETDNCFLDPIKYVQGSYDKDVTDEFILPAYNKGVSKEQIALADNDAVIFANFRPDRARQLTHMIYGSHYYDYKNVHKENIFFATMMNYEGIAPSMVAYPPQVIKNTFGQVLADHNKKQLRIAETEKYAHVTFFFDGGKEIDFPDEKKILVNSPKVATYDLQPEMSALEVTDKLLNEMDKTDVIIVNFANGDMVGHTGNLKAAIKAVETVDEMISRIYDKAQGTKTTLFITADHGNADEMADESGKPVTKHTTNPVPFIITDHNINLSNEQAALCNIAPTILKYLNIEIPGEMTGKPLLVD